MTEGCSDEGMRQIVHARKIKRGTLARFSGGCRFCGVSTSVPSARERRRKAERRDLMDRRSGVDRRGRSERRRDVVQVATEHRNGFDRRAGLDRRADPRRVPGDRREEPPEDLLS